MRLLRCFLGTEWRLQWRSLRFRSTAAAYGILCGLPSAVVFFAVRGRTEDLLGANVYLAETLEVQPFLTVVAAALVSGNRSGHQALEQTWPPLSGATLGNFGFISRRYLALATLLLPLTALPPAIAAGFALAGGSPITHPETWIWSWLVLIVPLALSVSAIWLATVTIAGHELAALVACLALAGLGRAALNEILMRFRMTIGDAGDWLGLVRLKGWLRWTRWWFHDEARVEHPGFVATEAPYDAAAALDWLAPRAALTAAVAVLALALATAFVHRTRRDLKPREVPADHPLRTYLQVWNRIRQRHSPDAALGIPERLAMVLGCLIVAVALGFLIDRQLDYRRLAEERYRVLTENRSMPTPIDVRPLDWHIAGQLSEDGRLELEVSGRLHNTGDELRDHLAFTVDEASRWLEITVPGRRIETSHAWDRLAISLEPPLAPSDTVELRFRLAGAPGETAFGLRKRGVSFARGFQAFTTARFPRDLKDLSRTRVLPSVSNRRIALGPGDFGPVPRYTTWKLTPPSTTPGEAGQLVPGEQYHFPAEISLDLEVPPKWFVADSCAHSSRLEDGRNRLRGACRVALDEFEIRGGELTALRSPGGETVVAALGPHRQRAQEILPSLAQAVALSESAWPGLDPVDGLAVLEWPPAFDVDLQQGTTGRRRRSRELLLGRLLLIPEASFVDSEPLEAARLVAGMLARGLMERRELETGQAHLFRSLFEALMIRRMGQAGDEGATVSGPSWYNFQLRMPILEARPLQNEVVFRRRLPAVMVEVESRTGGQALHAGIESFLSRDRSEPGTMRELFSDLEASSGVSLARMYEDYFVGRGIPELRLEEVRSVRLRDRWRVDGKVRNEGHGEVICPVVVEAGSEEVHATVTVDTMSAASFSVVLTSRPHAVLLDPRRTCHRRVTKASPTLEKAFLEN